MNLHLVMENQVQSVQELCMFGISRGWGEVNILALGLPYLESKYFEKHRAKPVPFTFM